MGNLAIISAAFAALAVVCNAASPEEWALRSIYQVMTDRYALTDGSTDKDCDLDSYCGGTWAGIVNKLDYIQGMGFNAIQISPVVENIQNDTEFGTSFHGYWPKNNYALNSKFGTEDDLKNLAKTLHDRDMLLMVDVVINNMAVAIDGSMPQPIDYAGLTPFNDAKYYHSYCNMSDYENHTIAQNCWLGSIAVALPDLDTESDEVLQMTTDWITQLISNYSIDGLRIDAAKHVADAFLPKFVKAAGVFTLGEVYTAVTEEMCRYQQESLVAGLPNYIQYFPLVDAFTKGAMIKLSEQKKYTLDNCNDTTVLGTFIENHDLPRFASMVDDMTLAKNALSYVILSDGIPTIYQGQEQHLKGEAAPANRQNLWATKYNTDAPLYNLTGTLNKLRNHAISVDSRYATMHSEDLFVDNSTMCSRKGPDGVQIVACFSNQGSGGGEYQLSIPGGFGAGVEVIEVLNCTKQTANSDGNITALMGQGEPKVFFPVDNLDGSGLCGAQLAKPKSGSGGNDSSSANGGGKKSAGSEMAAVRLGSVTLAAVVAVGVWFL